MGLSDILIYSGEIPLELMLWSFYIAIVIATIIMYVTKVRFGKLIYTLLDKGATTPETALAVDETGIKLGFFMKLALKNHLHYKDMLVAITADGKYYANTFLTDAPPTFKTLKSITRKRRSRIKDKNTAPDQAENTSDITKSAENDNVAEIISEQALAETATAPISEPSAVEFEPDLEAETPDGEQATASKPQRVTFDVRTAKYYIPEEVHAKVMSIFNDKGTKLWQVILLLIALGVITYFATFITEGLVDMFKNINAD